MSRSFFYVTRKNPKNVTRKLALRKVSLCLSVSIHSLACWLIGGAGGSIGGSITCVYGYMHIFTAIRRLSLTTTPNHPHQTQYDPVVRKHVLFTEAKLK